MTYPLPTNYATNSAVSATALNNANALVNLIWVLLSQVPMMPSARAATTGAETFTIVAGSVTTINGTTVDGVAVVALGAANGLGDYILIKDAPATSGVGSPNSLQPANGLYQVTAVGSNISVQRATQMSSTGAANDPSGMLIGVMAGTVNMGLAWFVVSPNSPSVAFTYGTTSIQFAQAIINPTEIITLTNKRLTKRVVSVTSAAVPPIVTDVTDVFKITALAVPITSWLLSGTPVDRDDLWICITDNGTSQSILWTGFAAITNGYTSLPNATPGGGKKITLHFIYDGDRTNWVLMAVDINGY